MNCSCWGEMLRFAPATNPGVRPKFVRPYLEQLRHIAATDPNRVVRVHCLGGEGGGIINVCRITMCSINMNPFNY